MNYDTTQCWLLIGLGVCLGLLVALAWVVAVDFCRWVAEVWHGARDDWKCEGWKEDPRL